MGTLRQSRHARERGSKRQTKRHSAPNSGVEQLPGDSEYNFAERWASDRSESRSATETTQADSKGELNEDHRRKGQRGQAVRAECWLKAEIIS